MIDNNTHIVFDLDDTLYKEINYVKSAYFFINRYIKSKHNIDLSKNIRKCLDDGINFFDYINQNLDYDQLILEYWKESDPNSGWVHCSFKTEGNRKQYLKAYKDENNKTCYQPMEE